MVPIAVEAAWPEYAGLMAWGIAARFRIPAGMPVVRAGTVPSTGCGMAAGRGDPAARGGRVPIGPAIVAQEAQALRGATDHAFAGPCAAGTGAIPGFARLACVPSITLPASPLDQIGSSCAMLDDP